MIETIEDYINLKNLSLNTDEIKKSCYDMADYIKKNFGSTHQFYKDPKSPITTNLFNSYNLMLYPLPGFYDLFTQIKETFHSIRVRENISYEKFYMQCWLNFYNNGQKLQWHHHWAPQFQAWHGFYCVDVGESSTIYRIPNGKEIEVKSENNLLVLSKSDGDTHKSSDWNETYPRITIAFDIVPEYSLQWDSNINHWIPI